MKTADLVVGTDYVFKERTWSTPERVTVLKPKHTATVKDRWGNKEKVIGVLVEYVNGSQKGEQVTVAPRTLTMLWSVHHGQQVVAGKYAAERAREEQIERERRAALAYAMHLRLLAAGAPVGAEGVSYANEAEDLAALVGAGFVPVPALGHFIGGDEVFSAVNDLREFMEDGTVALDDVAVLLGEQPKANEYSGFLGSWDWDSIRESEDPKAVDAVLKAYEAASTVEVAV